MSLGEVEEFGEFLLLLAVSDRSSHCQSSPPCRVEMDADAAPSAAAGRLAREYFDPC